jgi:hypothetical protein
MAVEHLIGVPEAVPVGGVAGGLAFLLLGMTRAGGQQRDVLGTPSLLKEPLDFVVAGVHGVLPGAHDESHRGALPAQEAHRQIDQGLKGVGDLPGVAQIVVQHQRHQRHRRRPMPIEDPLPFVGEHIDSAGTVFEVDGGMSAA